MSNLTVNQQYLEEAISMVSHAVASNNTIPILSGILFETENERLRLLGTDLNMAVETHIPAEISREGSFVLEARLIGEIVRRLPEQDVQIEVDPGNHITTIVCGDIDFELNGFDPAEFPTSFHDITIESELTLSSRMLKRLIKQTSYAIGDDQTRPFMLGALFVVKDDSVLMVATDGIKLAYSKTAKEFELVREGEMRDIIIPGRALSELNRLLDDAEDTQVKVMIGEAQILFEFADKTVFSRLIEGSYPNWEQFIPNEFSSSVVVTTSVLESAVERASLVSRKNRVAAVKLVPLQEKLKVASNTPEVGRMQEEIAATREGEDIEILFSSKYLLETLRAINDPEVCLRFTGPESPAVIAPANDEHHRCLIVPLRP